ncbi:MAG: glycosyltransferase family 2 protein [bacterium]|nr:glycosyltransferase family 2 protein [bacterium]
MAMPIASARIHRCHSTGEVSQTRTALCLWFCLLPLPPPISKPTIIDPVKISLVVVNYKSWEPLAKLIESASGADEIIVIDHSEDPTEETQLRTLDIDRLIIAENQGYGTGLNRGVRESTGDVLILSNPDVQFHPKAIVRLAEHASDSAVGLAGPQYCWDAKCQWLLPQVTNYTWQFELRTHFLPQMATRRHIQRQIGFWHASSPVDATVINGGVMAMSRSNFKACGGFDERFFLFFEENDLCIRLRRAGLRISLQPEAKIWHTVGHSVGAGEGHFYQRSLSLFRKRWFPRWYRTLFPEPPQPTWGRPRLASDPVPHPGEILLLSTNLGFIPSGRHEWSGGSWPPQDLLPPSAADVEYHLGVLRHGDIQYLGVISKQAGFRPLSLPA